MNASTRHWCRDPGHAPNCTSSACARDTAYISTRFLFTTAPSLGPSELKPEGTHRPSSLTMTVLATCPSPDHFPRQHHGGYSSSSMAPASSIVFAPGIVGNAHAITLHLSNDDRSRRRLYSPHGYQASRRNSISSAPSTSRSSEACPTLPPLDAMTVEPSTISYDSRFPSPSGLTIKIRKEDHVAYIEKREQFDADLGTVTELMSSVAEPTGIDALSRAMARGLNVTEPQTQTSATQSQTLPPQSRMRQLELEVETNLFLAELGEEILEKEGKRKRKLGVYEAEEDREMYDVAGPARKKVARLPDMRDGSRWRPRK